MSHRRLRLACLATGLFFFAVGGVAQAAPIGPKNGTILVIRHGDKNEPEKKSDPGLNAMGQDRARKYVPYFQHFDDGGKVLKLDALFAAEDSAASARPRLTLQPLAEATHLPLDTSTTDKAPEKLVATLSSGAFDGKTVLVSWRHGRIPQLLELLGADAGKLLGGTKWPDDVFGWVVILHYGPDGHLVSSRVVNEKLEPDDKRAPPPP